MNIYENVKVYDYAYKAFHKLRAEDGITNELIKNSLDPNDNLENARKAGESTGKSGSFFFFTKDRKFCVKTMFNEELDVFMLKLNHYFEHLEENKDSLLGRIYGIFQVRMKGVVPVNFILMANTVKIHQKEGLKTYDLKGSLVNRRVYWGEN